MKIGDILYFSPNYKFNQIDWNNKEELIKIFKDRVDGFYLNPADDLNKKEYGFVAGLVCVTLIDFIARISMGKHGRSRFEKWLCKNIPDFNEKDSNSSNRSLAKRFYEEFRNGLIHEGRIKKCGQFSYDFKNTVSVNDGIMLINPETLLKDLKKVFAEYIREVKENQEAFGKLKEALKRDFQGDVEYSVTGGDYTS
jgi:hypothetical protein